MNDNELLELMKSIDPQSVRVPPGVRKIVEAAILLEREACEDACKDSEDTGDGRGIERDVATWNKAVAYCVRRIKERYNG